MDQLINSMPALLRAAGDAREVALSVARAGWDHIAGEGLRNHTMVTDFQDKKLTVAVGDPVWQRQLESMSSQLLVKLNAVLGTGAVKFILYRVDAGALENRSPKNKQIEKAVAPDVIPVELVTAASSINDPKLRRAFLGAATSSLQRRKSRRQ